MAIFVAGDNEYRRLVERPGEARRKYRLKRCRYNTEDEDYSPNTLSNIQIHLRRLDKQFYLLLNLQ